VPETVCPVCGELGRLSPGEAWVDYGHCDSCHAAWLIDRRNTQRFPILIATPKKDRRKPPP
jgi:hypothetical protein